MASLSYMFAMIAGAVASNMLAGGLWLMASAPASRAAWSWGCTVYEGNSSKTVKHLAAGDEGATCSDGSKLTCNCDVSPCEGAKAALPSDLACAGAGPDADNSGCFQLHQAYGTSPPGLTAVAGRGSGTLTDACGAATLIKVYGSTGGLDLLKDWQAVTEAQADNSTVAKSALECQTKCAADPACKFFTYNDQGADDASYGFFQSLCFLQGELSCTGEAYSHHHGAISGPAKCASDLASATVRDSSLSCVTAAMVLVSGVRMLLGFLA